MKKIKLTKFLLAYLARINGQEKIQWDYIFTSGGPCYKNAATILKRNLHRDPLKKSVEVVKVLHLYTTPNS